MSTLYRQTVHLLVWADGVHDAAEIISGELETICHRDGSAVVSWAVADDETRLPEAVTPENAGPIDYDCLRSDGRVVPEENGQ